MCNTTWANLEHRAPSKVTEPRTMYLNEVSRIGQLSSTESGSMVLETVGRQED